MGISCVKMDPLQQPPLYGEYRDFSNCFKYEQQPADEFWCMQYVDDTSQSSDSVMESMHGSGSFNQHEIVFQEQNCASADTESIDIFQQTHFVAQEGYAPIQQINPSAAYSNYLQYESPDPASYNQLNAISVEDLCIDINDLEVSDDEMSEFPIESFNDLDFTSGQEPTFNNFTTVNSLPVYDATTALGFERQECVASKTDDEETEQHPNRDFKKQPLLSRFLLNALENPVEFSSMVKWIDRERGIFEFNSKNKEELAKRWGEIKQNGCVMTYQKMSRALRIYIKKEKVVRKMRRKLQYVFREEFLHSELQRISNEM